jgi:hypothetical protein
VQTRQVPTPQVLDNGKQTGKHRRIENMSDIDREKYRSLFIDKPIITNTIDNANESVGRIHKKAYEIANDNRKFEISNYWKRANYYWLFQASVYAGYFYAITEENNTYLCKNPEIILGVTCLGFLTALAWSLTNRGSKQWQNNWENHINELENEITGPLYKTASYKETWSVSKINELVSWFSVFAWILLGLKTISLFNCQNILLIIYMSIIAIIIGTFCLLGKGLVNHKEVQWYNIGEEQDEL